MAPGPTLSRPTLTDAPIPEDDPDTASQALGLGPSQTRPWKPCPKARFVTSGSDESAVCPCVTAERRRKARPRRLPDVRPSPATRSGNKPHRGKRPAARDPLPRLVQTSALCQRAVAPGFGIPDAPRVRAPQGCAGPLLGRSRMGWGRQAKCFEVRAELSQHAAPRNSILAGLKFSALSTQGCSRPAVWHSGDLPELTGHPAPPRWARARLPRAPTSPAPTCPRIPGSHVPPHSAIPGSP